MRLLILLYFILVGTIAAQEEFPKNYFRSPVDTTIILAGNFAELRPNHFHGGLDIKTFSREGLPVYAIADGYVSRIKISSYGYGRVLYVTHPNGYVSVYAHLSSFADSIGAYTKHEQYKQKLFTIELFPKPKELLIKKGQVIAFSGNTGHSSGPHLHFEIREEKSEKALNPLLFGMPVTDNAKPQLERLKIFPVNKNATINKINNAHEYSLKNTPQGLKPVTPDTIKLSGNIYFGLQGYDTETRRGGKNGIYSIELQVNNKRIFLSELNKVGFDQTRAINTFTDYPTYLKTGRLIHRSYVETNNKLGVYKDVVNKGIVNFTDNAVYTIKYTVKDIYGNATVLEFPVKSERPGAEKKIVDSAYTKLFRCTEPNKFESENILVDLPANILYDDIYFRYSTSKNVPVGCYSKIYHIHSSEVPLNDAYTLTIQPIPVNDSLKKHLILARINKAGSKEYAGGEIADNKVVAKVKQFGAYVIFIDTIAPAIKPVNISAGKNCSKLKQIAFKVGDNFSGIKSFSAYIDDNWVLMEYEHKKNMLYYIIDKSAQYNPLNNKSKHHTLVLYVTDNAANTKKYSVSFIM
ncbi:MAG: M23 family metallopeptidase [Bacteroidia bacterium]|nr:M23 family metallopeptidase [Bacteroidia bacterium]